MFLVFKTQTDQEIQLWKRYWSTEKTKVDTITSTLEHLSEKKINQMFPDITRILTTILTTASTSATVERANSSLRYIKTDFRNSMTEDRFNALILMYVHRDIKLDREKLLIYMQRNIQDECCCKTLCSLKVFKMKIDHLFSKISFVFYSLFRVILTISSKY